MRGIRLIPDDVNINFIGMRYIALVISSIVVIGSIVVTAVAGLNFGIDFTGGTVIEIRTPEVIEIGKLRSGLGGLGLGDVSIQEFGQPDDFLIRLGEQEGGAKAQKGAIDKVRGFLDAQFEEPIDYRRTEFVGPQVGEELKRQGIYAVLFSLLGILAYIWFRFEWQFGVASIIALAHDSVAIIGLFALTQMQFDLSTVAAVLMIAGYSINDTVVVFDRIRENLRKYKKKPLAEVFNLSINQTLSRTLMTSMTTMLALIALYVFGGEVIRGFVDALIVGILIGTYSSVFVAAPALLKLNVRRDATPEKPEGEGGEEEDELEE